MAEEASKQFQRRVATFERELQHLQYRNIICSRRAGLFEHMAHNHADAHLSLY
ncbi:hypothetical protein Hdeb2414_s1023g00973681 [Helianthus debilis subsp. tardiflorus]